MDSLVFIAFARAADRYEYRYEMLVSASGVVFLQVTDVAPDLVEIGGLGVDSILELDNEDRPILENDEVGATSATAMKLELENETEA